MRRSGRMGGSCALGCKFKAFCLLLQDFCGKNVREADGNPICQLKISEDYSQAKNGLGKFSQATFRRTHPVRGDLRHGIGMKRADVTSHRLYFRFSQTIFV